MILINKRFILIKDRTVISQIITNGFLPIYNEDDICIFENTQHLKDFVQKNIPDEKYIFTDKMLI